MAKDKLEVELIPKISQAVLSSLRKQFEGLIDPAKLAKEIGSIGFATSGAGQAGKSLDTFSQLGDTLGKFTNAVNPAHMQLFDMALQDAMAVFGQALVPVLQTVTKLLQIFGDFLASVVPSQEQMNELMKAFEPLLNAVNDILATLAPTINDLITTGLKIFTEAVKIAAEGMMVMVKILAESAAILLDVFHSLLSMLPGAETAFEKGMAELAGKLHKLAASDLGHGRHVAFSRSSRGAGGRGAQQVSFADLSSRAIQSAFGLGNPIQDTANNTAKTNEILNKMEQKLPERSPADYSGAGGDF